MQHHCKSSLLIVCPENQRKVKYISWILWCKESKIFSILKVVLARDTAISGNLSTRRFWFTNGMAGHAQNWVVNADYDHVKLTELRWVWERYWTNASFIPDNKWNEFFSFRGETLRFWDVSWIRFVAWLDLDQHAYWTMHETVCAYGDPAYSHRVHLQSPFREVVLTDDMKLFNASMSANRISVEWLFGDAITTLNS